jgi:hypothetical protein
MLNAVPSFGQAITVIQPERFDVSQSLRDIAPTLAVPQGQERVPDLRRLPPLPRGQRGRSAAPSLINQTAFAAPLPIEEPFGFDGIGASNGYSVLLAPPDTVGAAGTTQYVQWVNTSFAVFDKETGKSLYGPASGNTIWRGFGGKCEAANEGDPVVLFDAASKRWIMSQFSVRTPPYMQCVAVSTTEDAAGQYARYAYRFPAFNDYGKFGVWGDGYYATFNIFKATFDRTTACAIDRQAALAALKALLVCFDIPKKFRGILPVDAQSPNVPSTNTPGLFVGLDVDSLVLWRFAVNWSDPAKSKVIGPQVIPVAPFDQALCNGDQACVPQKGTRDKLDTLGDRLMYRAAYSDLGTRQAIIVTHSVNVGSANELRSGVRWYELNVQGSDLNLAQQGTLAASNRWRWMSSAAVDRAGNMLLGYSASSPNEFPSIWFAGRRASDPPGQLLGETAVRIGANAQPGERWGDYSSMTVDPSDGCTFWFTGQYIDATHFGWSTFIARTRFTECK